MAGRIVKISAPGKLILSGEHAVVYGKPAILTAVNRRLWLTISPSVQNQVISSESSSLIEFAENLVLKVLNRQREKLKIEISSTIPVGRGLGSSAALAVAMAAGLFKYFRQSFNREKINEIAYEIEKKQHGFPSGGDNTIATFGGFLWYRKETESLKLFHSLPIDLKKLPKFVLIDSGRPQESTGEMVVRVKKLAERNRIKIMGIFNQIEETTKQLLLALNQINGQSIESAIGRNERLLEKLGVVGSLAQKIISKIERAGGAAKICGAGGVKKGSGIILAFHNQREKVFKIAEEEKLSAFEVELGEEGVRDEKKD